MPDNKRKRIVRLQVLVPVADLALIKDFRFRTRMPTQAAAVRELLRRGLASVDKELSKAKTIVKKGDGARGKKWQRILL